MGGWERWLLVLIQGNPDVTVAQRGPGSAGQLDAPDRYQTTDSQAAEVPTGAP
jgi:hypothetical protein